MSTNILFAAMLSCISDCITQLNLPIESPVQSYQIATVSYGDGIEGWVSLNCGYSFHYTHGYVKSFRCSRTFHDVQDINKIPMFYGISRMTTNEAVTFARTCVRKLGYKDEEVYADLDPVVQGPFTDGTNTVPFYMIEWPSPQYNDPNIAFEIDAENKTLVSMWLSNKNCRRSVIGLTEPSSMVGIKPDEKERFFREALVLISDYSKRLDLRTGDVSRKEIDENSSRIPDRMGYGTVKFKSGWKFFLDGNYVDGFEAPDAFYRSAEVKVKDYVGTIVLGESEIVEIARKTVKQLGCDVTDFGLDRKPKIRKPAIVRPLIPRFEAFWDPFVICEVDAEHGVVKKLRVHRAGK